jgi:hypothetical protein
MLQAIQCEYRLMPSPSRRHGVTQAAQLVHELLAMAVMSPIALVVLSSTSTMRLVCYLIEDLFLDAAHLNTVT